MSYEFDFSVVFEHADVFLIGALLTLKISVFSMAIGLCLAALTLLCRMSRFWFLRILAIIYVEVIRNTPFLVQLFFFFFALPGIGVRMGPEPAAILALAVNAGAYGAEILRGGVAAAERGQAEAGLALGLSRVQTFGLIVFKPALRAVYPALTSQFILLLLTSSIAAAISASELTQAAQTLDAVTFRSFEIYLTVTLLYLLITIAFSRLFRRLYAHLFPYPVQ